MNTGFDFPGASRTPTLLGSGRGENANPLIEASDQQIAGVSLLGRDDVNDILIGTRFADKFFGEQHADASATKDTVSYERSNTRVVIENTKTTSAVEGHGTGGHAQGDLFYGIEDIIGSTFDDSFKMVGDQDNEIRGGRGNDTFIGGGGGGVDFIYGGGAGIPVAEDGTDIADYSNAADGLIVEIDGSVPPGENGAYITVLDDGTGSSDNLYSIERIVGTPFRDVFEIAGLFPQGTVLTLDGGGTAASPGEHDVIDVSALGSSVIVDLKNGRGSISQANGAGGIIYLENFGTEIKATAYDDDITDLSGGPQIIDAGAGNNIVASNGINAEIYLGAGDDVLVHAGAGTIVEGGAGRDTVWFSDGILFADAEAGDRLTQTGDQILYAGQTLLTGGTRWIYSESPYAIGQGGLFKYGKNQVGELVIRDFRGDEMFVSNYVGGPGAPYNTAGVYLVEYDIKAVRFSEDWPDGYTILNTWRFFLGDYLKANYGVSLWNEVDPLVLDLDGDGLELTAVTSASPKFDIDGDGYREPTGWVRGDDGLLARDLNGNGRIDDVAELFGGSGVSGFTALSALDANQDGKISAADSGFAALRVWRDLDQDGVTDAGELQTLTQAGIASISLGATERLSPRRNSRKENLGYRYIQPLLEERLAA